MQAFNFRIHKLYCQQTDFKNHHQIQKFDVLDNLPYVIAGILVIVWAVGFFGMNIKSGIHILLIVTANLIMLGIIQHQKKKKTI
jgi:Family of unknown function (DUF5670)